MSFSRWIRRLFGAKPEPTKTPVQSPLHKKPTPKQSAAEGEGDFPEPFSPDNPDGADHPELETREEQILREVGEKLERGDYKLPHLPATNATVLALTNQPSADFKDMAAAIETDPVLTSELMKMANSVMFGGSHPADSVHQATMRLGQRNLRSLILGLSMKGALSRAHGVARHAEEVWRQATSVGRISRELAQELGHDADKAFLVGLLQDIGKVPLLDLLDRTVTSRMEVSKCLIASLFSRYHERVGAEMAASWKLPEEVAAVAACHHDFEANTEFPQVAALASIAHKIDLHMSLGARRLYWQLSGASEFKVLGTPFDKIKSVLEQSVRSFLEAQEAQKPQEQREPVGAV